MNSEEILLLVIIGGIGAVIIVILYFFLSKFSVTKEPISLAAQAETDSLKKKEIIKKERHGLIVFIISAVLSALVIISIKRSFGGFLDCLIITLVGTIVEGIYLATKK